MTLLTESERLEPQRLRICESASGQSAVRIIADQLIQVEAALRKLNYQSILPRKALVAFEKARSLLQEASVQLQAHQAKQKPGTPGAEEVFVSAL